MSGRHNFRRVVKGTGRERAPFVWIGVFCCAIFCGLSTAWASDPTARFALAGQAGLGGTKMSDANREIDRGNHGLLIPQQKQTVDPLRNAWAFSWDLHARVVGPFSLSLGGGKISGKTGVDYDQVITIAPSGSFYRGSAFYEIPFRPRSSVILRVGGGPLYMSSGRLKASHEFRSVEGTQRLEEATYEGKGWGGQGGLQAEVVLSEKATILVDVGYRRLSLITDRPSWRVSRVRDITSTETFTLLNGDSFLGYSFLAVETAGRDGRKWKPLDREEQKAIGLDFSGVQGTIGLRFYLF